MPPSSVFSGPLVIGILLATALSGCLDVSKKTGAAPDEIVAPLPEPWAPPAVPKIDATQLLKGLEGFVKSNPIRSDNQPTHASARDALADEFSSAGLEVWRQKFENGIPQENICGIKLGVGEPDQWVVVGGHYDTTTRFGFFLPDPGPGERITEGAYDDGSGTWITMELAKAFAKTPNYYSILFCAFDGEERGLEGSRVVFETLQTGEGFPHEVTDQRGMMDLDMFGVCWPVRAPIWTMTNNEQLWTAANAVRGDLGVPDDMFKRAKKSVGGSDFAHWIKTDIPTIYYSSDFDEVGLPTPVPNPAPVPAVAGAAYPWWHQSDTIETMTAMAGSPDMLRAGFQTATDLAASSLTLLANRPDLALLTEDATPAE